MSVIQSSLFTLLDASKIDVSKSINVASVPQRSLFRYPGGKTWLVPYIRSWMMTLQSRTTSFIELFAGGGIVSLTVAAEGLAEQVILVELDDDVAAVWLTSLNDQRDWLAQQIIEFEMTPENVDKVLSHHPTSIHEQAFQTILRNRVNHGGILAMGAGRIKYGENGKGLRSRWYPLTLKRRIFDISNLTNLTFIHGDAFTVLSQYQTHPNAVFFIDPPYTASTKKAGTRLYRHAQIDHERLFEQAAKITGDFLMTYDNDDVVRLLAKRYGFDCEAIAMKNTHHAQMNELLISKNLEWLRQ